MTDIQKLKALAEGCRDEVIRSHGWAGMIEDADLLRRDEAFLKECSPDVVLELIAEIERLKEDPHMRAVRSLRADCDQLKAENEALVTALNDILRVTPMSVEAFGIAALVLGELGVSKEASHDA